MPTQPASEPIPTQNVFEVRFLVPTASIIAKGGGGLFLSSVVSKAIFSIRILNLSSNLKSPALVDHSATENL